MEQQIKTRLSEADDYLQKAKDELCKPEEDVVPFSVYQNAYHAIMNCLSSYLLDNDELIPDSPTVEVLLRNCRKLDSRFNDLHLSPLFHPTEESEDVWMNIDVAKDFLDLALETCQMVNQNN